MRKAIGMALIFSLSLPASAGLFDDLKFAVTGHIADFQSRSQPDQVLGDVDTLAVTRLRTDDPGQDRLHYGSGKISLVKKDGMAYIQLHPDIEIGFAPDLYLYLSPEPNIDTEARFASTQQIEVAKIVKGEGASYYSLGEIDPVLLGSIRSVTVWCRQFDEFMASGNLEPSF